MRIINKISTAISRIVLYIISFIVLQDLLLTSNWDIKVISLSVVVGVGIIFDLLSCMDDIKAFYSKVKPYLIKTGKVVYYIMSSIAILSLVLSFFSISLVSGWCALVFLVVSVIILLEWDRKVIDKVKAKNKIRKVAKEIRKDYKAKVKQEKLVDSKEVKHDLLKAKVEKVIEVSNRERIAQLEREVLNLKGNLGFKDMAIKSLNEKVEVLSKTKSDKRLVKKEVK